MADPGRLERLERRVRELEEELAREKRGRGAARARIDTMSPEVTDSNPYRCGEGCGALCQAAEGGAEGGPWLGTAGLGEVGEAHGCGESSDGWECQGRGWGCSGGCRAVRGAGALCGAGEGCSRISHLAGMAGVDVRVTLYYLALQYRQGGQGERERKPCEFFS